MAQLPKNYDHKEAEARWQKQWNDAGVHAWDPSQPRENTFVIDTPPPTVSGVLHMGHIFSYTQADFVARYQRMSGKTVFYPMGFDDNGLPTERLVEKTRKIQAHKYIAEHGREEFIRLCQDIVKEAEEEFRKLFKSIALSVDWSQEYQTISKESRRLSQLSFLDLYYKNQVERKLQPMLWDPVDQTAIAQAEVVDKEMPGSMNYIEFRVQNSESSEENDKTELRTLNPGLSITIATTRPELIPACVAIFYHPDDRRYQHLRGKTAITPLFGVKVPILEDDTVEMDKGTGIMMCCTFGDEADIKKWEKHNLPMRVVLNKYGKMELSGNAHELNGLKAAAAREKILEMLKEAGLLVKQENIMHAVKCAERSGAPLEILPTYQWFVKVLDKKLELKDRARECSWHPEFMKVRMDQWIDGLKWDWCISRQRFFGVPFPVWHMKTPGQERFTQSIVADRSQLPVDPMQDLPLGYRLESKVESPDGFYFVAVNETTNQVMHIYPEMDVMDTWATSSISPQLSSRGITPELAEDKQRHAKLFPADLRPQAHEIIRTWAFYTLLKAHLHEKTIPWHNLMISGWCLAPDKTKMSKSKGNVITPVELIVDKGADAVRYWASTSRLGADTAFSEDVLKIGRKLVTKLWNASAFVAIHIDKLDKKPFSAMEDMNTGIIIAPLDKWILTRLLQTIEQVTLEFERFEYCDARIAAEQFFWNDFCDNYLELVKTRVYNEGNKDPEGQRSAVHTLYHCLNALLRLFAPFMPHVTEELFSHIFAEDYKKLGSVHARGSWPQAVHYPVDENAEKSGNACVDLLNAVRKAKSEKNLSIKYPIEHLAVSAGPNENVEWNMPASLLEDLKGAANAQEIEWVESLSGESITESGNYSLKIRFAAQSDIAQTG